VLFRSRLFMRDELFIPLLQNKTYHNLDEDGTFIDESKVVDNGTHSIREIQERMKAQHNLRMNIGKHEHDHFFIDPGDSVSWAGSVQWKEGTLKIVNKSEYFPAGRNLLFYHCRGNCMINFPEDIKNALFREMRTNGYLLPSWRPLQSRFACGDFSADSMKEFRPRRDCAPSNASLQVSSLTAKSSR